MTPSKPYIIRAIYEWIVDNNLTPYIAVDAAAPDVMVPKEHIKDERIILDISAIAANNLTISNDSVEFKARFSGTSHNIYIPISAVMVIYAQENDHGMAFSPEDFDEELLDDEEYEYGDEYDEYEEDNSANQKITTAPQKNKTKLTLLTGGKQIT